MRARSNDSNIHSYKILGADCWELMPKAVALRDALYKYTTTTTTTLAPNIR